MPLVLVLAPVPAVLLGALVMRHAGIPSSTWGQNLAATVLGAGLVLATHRARGALTSPARASGIVAMGALALLGATFLHRGIDGVHRWVSLGSVPLHAGAVVLPPLLVLLVRRHRTGSAVMALVTLCVLWRQPDAAQAGAFALAWSVARAAEHGRAAAWAITAALLLAVATAVRADPLPQVAYVEGIVGMAARAGSTWGIASLAALTLPPLAWLRANDRETGLAMAAYVVGTLGAAWLGSFPVPYLGYGVSPILGYYLAMVVSAPAMTAPTALSERIADGRDV